MTYCRLSVGRRLRELEAVSQIAVDVPEGVESMTPQSLPFREHATKGYRSAGFHPTLLNISPAANREIGRDRTNLARPRSSLTCMS